MEFNVLPKSKFLSLSPRYKHRSSQNTTQTVNVILPPKTNNQEIDEPSVSVSTSKQPIHETEQIEQNESIHYATREVKLDEPAEKLNPEDSISTINFLKLVVQSYMSNPIKYNEYVICSVPVLENLIETLTGCDDRQIDIADFESGCCGTSANKHIVPITKIWCRTGEVSDVFKYKYSAYLQVFEEFRISLKFAYVE